MRLKICLPDFRSCRLAVVVYDSVHVIVRSLLLFDPLPLVQSAPLFFAPTITIQNGNRHRAMKVTFLCFIYTALDNLAQIKLSGSARFRDTLVHTLTQFRQRQK